MKKMLFAICASLLLAACGAMSSSGPGSVTAKFKIMGKDVTKDVAVKQGLVTTDTVIPKMGSAEKPVAYEINVANFEFDPNAKRDEDILPKKDGEMVVTVAVLGEKNATAATPLKPGTYAAAMPADGENVYGKTWTATIRFFDEGKVKIGQSSAQFAVGTRQGSVKISSVTDGKVTGEIDLGDNAASFKGNFSANLPKK